MSVWLNFYKYGNQGDGKTGYAHQPILIHLDVFKAIEPAPSGKGLRVVWTDLSERREHGAHIHADITMVGEQLERARRSGSVEAPPLRGLIALKSFEDPLNTERVIVPTDMWRIVTAMGDRSASVAGLGSSSGAYGETPETISERLADAGHKIIQIGARPFRKLAI